MRSSPTRKPRSRQSSASSGSDSDYARLHRIIKIISLIQGQPGWDARRLAVECNVRERTIYRDMNLLQGANIPYYFDREHKGYQIRRDFFMKPVDLTLDEALAIIALGEHIGGRQQIPMMRAAERAVAKIRSQLPDKLRRELENLDGHLGIRLAAATSPDGITDVYEKMREAIGSRRALRCQYESMARSAEGRPFLFKPYALFFSQRAWYAVGHHGDRGEVRCLKLNRFSEVTPTDQSYVIPADFSLKKHLGNAWRMIRGRKRYEIEMRFDAQFAETISDTHWHDTQQQRWNPDGSMTLTCKVDGLDEIVWWVLSMGPHCRVVAPGELASRVKELANQIVKLYPSE